MTDYKRNIYYRKSLKERSKEYLIHIGLLFILLIYVESIKNHIYIQNMNYKSINYEVDMDEFRKLNVNETYISRLLQDIEKEEKKESSIWIGSRAKYGSIDYFTMTMIINQFDSLEYRRINKISLNKVIDHYKDNSSYQTIRSYYESILLDLRKFPIQPSKEDKPYYSYVDTWYATRTYGGNRYHEGTDIIPYNNVSGKYQVRSITAGVVEQIGWLEKGGYRIGVRSEHGGYFYYAHLDSWIDGLLIGDEVIAGQIIGYMGDTGYGEEGTRGQFVVHLHQGIYVETEDGEMSINSYYILKYLEGIS